MDFKLNDLQKDIVKTVHDYCEKKIKPDIGERDHAGDFGEEHVKALMQDMGIAGIYYPEEYGGMGNDGGDVLTYILCVEEIAKYDAGMAATVSASISLGTNPIWQYGRRTEEKISRTARNG